MKLQVSSRARKDVADIGHFISKHNPAAARMVRDTIRAALDMLATHPHAGRALGRAGLHKFVVPRLPYLIFYRVDEAADAVQIVTIRHAARLDRS